MKLMEHENLFCIHGPPGCGKTYSISKSVEKNIATYGPGKVMVCSLTKTAAAEAAGRVNLPKHQVGTLHSFAFRALGSPKIAEANLDEWNKYCSSYALNSGQNDVNDQTLFDVHSTKNENDAIFSEYTLMRSLMRPRDRWKTTVRSFAKKWEEWKRNEDLLDFTDLIECAARDVFVAPGDPDVIYMDEAQDSSTLEAHLIKQWARTTQKTVIVGDPNQSLYTWRGADPDEFFPHEMAPERKHVLSQSFRVPKSVLERSLEWISQMNGYAAEVYKPRRDAEGVCRHLETSLNVPGTVVRELEKHMARGKVVMLLASCGFMLKPIIAELRNQGIPFHNPFRRRNASWNPLHASNGLSGCDRMMAWLAPRKDLWGDDARVWNIKDIRKWGEILESKGVLKGVAKSAFKGLTEDTPAVAFLREWFTPEAIQRVAAQDFDWWLNHVKKDRKKTLEFPAWILKKHGPKGLTEAPQCILGTVHSVKGGQADVVMVAPDLSFRGMKEWTQGDASSVYRLFYVAMTRAREELYLLSPGSKLAVDWDGDKPRRESPWR